jgi:hypothetical protein
MRGDRGAYDLTKPLALSCCRPIKKRVHFLFLLSENRYAVLPSGDLLLTNVTREDKGVSFQCIGRFLQSPPPDQKKTNGNASWEEEITSNPAK